MKSRSILQSIISCLITIGLMYWSTFYTDNYVPIWLIIGASYFHGVYETSCYNRSLQGKPLIIDLSHLPYKNGKI